MATTIVTKSGSGAPAASDLVAGELAVDLTNKRLYTEDSSAAIIELGTNPSGNVTFGDNGKAIFGAGSDLQIYHDGSNSYVKDAGAGNLKLQGASYVLMESDEGKIMLRGQKNNALQAYYDGSAKLATTATGIDVTGSVTADGLVVDTGSVGGFKVTQDAGAGVRLTAYQGTTNSNVRTAYVDAQVFVVSTGEPTGNTVTERFRISSDGSLSTPTLGTSNVRFGVNAGNSITSGGNYNTVVGDEAGTAITTGDYNVAVGYPAGTALTTGGGNVGIGGLSLTAASTGNNNTAVGFQASRYMTTASNTTAIGYLAGGGLGGATVMTGNDNTLVGASAGLKITTGAENVAIGANALDANTSGVSNVAVGQGSLDSNTTANNNTAVGHDSMKSNTTGAENTAVGKGALNGNTTASNNTAVGRSALALNTTGASNTGVGVEALTANTTGIGNVAVGSKALKSNTTANNNVALGLQTLETNTTGTQNTSLGNYALNANTTASNNTAVGYSALIANTTGTPNVAVGSLALDANTTGGSNVAVGYESLTANTTGNFNTALGRGALAANTTAHRSTAVGYNVLTNSNNTSDGNAYNTGLGFGAGAAVTTGVQNTLIGGLAGDAITTGTQNILIGYVATASAVGASNQTVIGAGVTSVGNGNFTFGSGTSDSNIANGATTITAPSDERYKEDITDATAGLSFINALRPVTYRWKKEKDIPTTQKAYVEGSDKRVINDYTNHGFIAQEVKAAIDADDSIKDGFDMWTEDGADGRQRLGPSALIPMLVKAIQEQTAVIAALTDRIAALEG